MAFASDTIWDDYPRANAGFPSIRTSWLLSGVAVLGLGVALAGWSLATVAAVHKMETSLSSTPTLLPESAFAPGAIALFDPAHRIEHLGDKLRQHLAYPDAAAPQAAPARHHEKSGRVVAATTSAHQPASHMPLAERFGERMSKEASAAHQRGSDFIRSRLAAAGSVKSSRMALADAAALLAARAASPAKPVVKLPQQVALLPQEPSNTRFAHDVANAIPKLLPTMPSADRFGSAGNDAEKPSRIALAVIDAELDKGTEVLSPPLPSAPPARNAAVPDDTADDTRKRDGEPFSENMPDNPPLPTWRPALKAPEEPAAAPAPAPAPTPAPQNARPTRAIMAYAKPDDLDDESPLSGLGRLFERKPRLPGLGNGVAVYDIRNAVVYMPDGERLEAHSGMGTMADKPRYVDEKNRGPTPPNTYKLVLRERRFHGVEAIRLLPIDGNNKFGRVGLLAHTYMLRGGLAESNGCVVFKDYKRFLQAFKRGKVTRLVVVPDLSHASPATLASAARGA
ncbi:MAG: hypothetical protein BGN87_21290 [Rhizobiales bacterium 65-79]|jgi:hypothetical protein|nr:MAG: hypothetical protein BGN87_21290 [Rhizobiales bacterium 65-79]